MKYKLGVSSVVFRDCRLDEGIEKIAKRGFDLIELGFEQFEDFVSFDSGGFAILNRLRKDYGLTYTVHGPLTGFNLGSPIGLIRKNSVRRLKWYIEATSKVGGTILVVHASTLVPFRMRFSMIRLFSGIRLFRAAYNAIVSNKYFMLIQKLSSYGIERVVQSLSEAYGCAESRNVFICCENLSVGFKEPEDFSFILKGDLPHLGLTYDPSHSMITDTYNRDWIEIFKKKIMHLHAIDFNAKNGDGHAVIGEGKIDWNAILKKLHAIGYGGYLTIENFNIEDALKSKKYLECLMG